MARLPRTPRTPRPSRPSRPPRNQSGEPPACRPASRSSTSSPPPTHPAGKREIARAFGLKGNDKIALKALLKDMADEGLIDSAPGRAFHKMGGVPKVTVLRVADVDDSGNVWGVPEQWHAETPPPKIRLIDRGGKRSALGWASGSWRGPRSAGRAGPAM